jgi:5-enolpyruvylshikimate-3-phosphate synthase
MTFTVAGLVAEGQTEITGTEYIPDSFPGFFQCLASIS